MLTINPLLQADFYKVDHKSQYPEGTTRINANLTARASRTRSRQVVFFGLQYFVKEYLMKQWDANFFKKDKTTVVARYKTFMDCTLGPDTVDVSHIAALHDLGYLPIRIRALKEGSFVPLKVPMLTIEATKLEFAWLSQMLETILSNVLWGAITSATTARSYYQLFHVFALATGGDTTFVPWQGHDFSMRGMFGLEAAAISGASHLAIGFTGTDTMPAIELLEQCYGADITKELVGASVPATEHSVMCAGGKDGEYATYERLITKAYPKGIVSIVSDTWDLWNVVTNYLPKLKDQIMARNGKVVIRPDSGDPVHILCGYVKRDGLTDITTKTPEEYWHEFYYEQNGKCWRVRKAELEGKMVNEVYEIPMHEAKGLIELLWEIFGGTETEKGFKVLDSHIGAIYGDSITPERAGKILERLYVKGFASTNVVLGIGSYTYQYTTRDTYGMAVKATYCEVNGEPRELFKDPATDNGVKKSAKGLLAVYENENNGEYFLKDQATEQEHANCALELVFEDGKLLREHTLAEIRKRLAPKEPSVVKTVAEEPVTQSEN